MTTQMRVSALFARAWESTLRFRAGNRDQDLPLARRVWDVPRHADHSGRLVALTFDDGPHPDYTPAVLDVLGASEVQATFFMVGEAAVRYPDIVRRVAAEGHVVGGHSWTHQRITGLGRRAFSAEIDRTYDLLSSLSGEVPSLVRPPHGCRNRRVVDRLSERHLTTVLWSLDPHDWAEPAPAAISDTVLAALDPGAIVLLHDGGGDRSATVAALPKLLEAIRVAEYDMVAL